MVIVTFFAGHNEAFTHKSVNAFRLTVNRAAARVVTIA